MELEAQGYLRVARRLEPRLESCIRGAFWRQKEVEQALSSERHEIRRVGLAVGADREGRVEVAGVLKALVNGREVCVFYQEVDFFCFEHDAIDVNPSLYVGGGKGFSEEVLRKHEPANRRNAVRGGFQGHGCGLFYMCFCVPYHWLPP